MYPNYNHSAAASNDDLSKQLQGSDPSGPSAQPTSADPSFFGMNSYPGEYDHQSFAPGPLDHSPSPQPWSHQSSQSPPPNPPTFNPSVQSGPWSSYSSPEMQRYNHTLNNAGPSSTPYNAPSPSPGPSGPYGYGASPAPGAPSSLDAHGFNPNEPQPFSHNLPDGATFGASAMNPTASNPGFYDMRLNSSHSTTSSFSDAGSVHSVNEEWGVDPSASYPNPFDSPFVHHAPEEGGNYSAEPQSLELMGSLQDGSPSPFMGSMQQQQSNPFQMQQAPFQSYVPPGSAHGSEYSASSEHLARDFGALSHDSPSNQPGGGNGSGHASPLVVPTQVQGQTQPGAGPGGMTGSFLYRQPLAAGSSSSLHSNHGIPSQNGGPQTSTTLHTVPGSAFTLPSATAHVSTLASVTGPGPGGFGALGGFGQPGHIAVMHTDDASSKETQFLRRRCFNCRTTDPPSWRRSTLNSGKIVCNKCGLYERTHMRPRPPRFDEMRTGSGGSGTANGASGSGVGNTGGGSSSGGGGGTTKRKPSTKGGNASGLLGGGAKAGVSKAAKVKGPSPGASGAGNGPSRNNSVSSNSSRRDSMSSSASGTSDWDEAFNNYAANSGLMMNGANGSPFGAPGSNSDLYGVGSNPTHGHNLPYPQLPPPAHSLSLDSGLTAGKPSPIRLPTHPSLGPHRNSFGGPASDLKGVDVSNGNNNSAKRKSMTTPFAVPSVPPVGGGAPSFDPTQSFAGMAGAPEAAGGAPRSRPASRAGAIQNA